MFDIYDMTGALEFPNNVIELAGGIPALHPERKGQLDRSPLKNWVEKHGGLPTYINSVATALLRDHPEWGISRVIATAVNWAKKACATGKAFGGKVTVSKAVQAAACTAVAQWEKKKAEASLELDKHVLQLSEETAGIELWKAKMRTEYTEKELTIPDVLYMSDEMYFGLMESDDDTPIELSDWDWEGVSEVNDVEAFMSLMELSAAAQSPIRLPVLNLSEDGTQISANEFEKEILTTGSIHYKDGRKVAFTPEMLKMAYENFNKNVLESGVNCQYVNDKGEHTESGKYYAGKVTQLSLDNPDNPSSLKAKINLTDEAAAMVKHNPKYGASVTLHPHYVEPSSLRYHGSTLFQVALTPRARKTGMSEWAPIAASDERDGVIDLSMETFITDVETSEGGKDMADNDKPLELSDEQIQNLLSTDAVKNAIQAEVQTQVKAKDDQIVELSNQIGTIKQESYESVVKSAINTYRNRDGKGVPPVILDAAETLMLSFGFDERNELLELSVPNADGEGSTTEKMSKIGVVTKLLDETVGLLDLSGEKGSGKGEEELELSGDSADAAVNELVALAQGVR
jgi:hypothetical protein